MLSFAADYVVLGREGRVLFHAPIVASAGFPLPSGTPSHPLLLGGSDAASDACVIAAPTVDPGNVGASAVAALGSDDLGGTHSSSWQVAASSWCLWPHRERFRLAAADTLQPGYQRQLSESLRAAAADISQDPRRSTEDEEPAARDSCRNTDTQLPPDFPQCRVHRQPWSPKQVELLEVVVTGDKLSSGSDKSRAVGGTASNASGGAGAAAETPPSLPGSIRSSCSPAMSLTPGSFASAPPLALAAASMTGKSSSKAVASLDGLGSSHHHGELPLPLLLPPALIASMTASAAGGQVVTFTSSFQIGHARLVTAPRAVAPPQDHQGSAAPGANALSRAADVAPHDIVYSPFTSSLSVAFTVVTERGCSDAETGPSTTAAPTHFPSTPIMAATMTPAKAESGAVGPSAATLQLLSDCVDAAISSLAFRVAHAKLTRLAAAWAADRICAQRFESASTAAVLVTRRRSAASGGGGVDLEGNAFLDLAEEGLRAAYRDVLLGAMTVFRASVTVPLSLRCFHSFATSPSPPVVPIGAAERLVWQLVAGGSSMMPVEDGDLAWSIHELSNVFRPPTKALMGGGDFVSLLVTAALLVAFRNGSSALFYEKGEEAGSPPRRREASCSLRHADDEEETDVAEGGHETNDPAGRNVSRAPCGHSLAAAQLPPAHIVILTHSHVDHPHPNFVQQTANGQPPSAKVAPPAGDGQGARDITVGAQATVGGERPRRSWPQPKWLSSAMQGHAALSSPCNAADEAAPQDVELTVTRPVRSAEGGGHHRESGFLPSYLVRSASLCGPAVHAASIVAAISSASATGAIGTRVGHGVRHDAAHHSLWPRVSSSSPPSAGAVPFLFMSTGGRERLDVPLSGAAMSPCGHLDMDMCSPTRQPSCIVLETTAGSVGSAAATPPMTPAGLKSGTSTFNVADNLHFARPPQPPPPRLGVSLATYCGPANGTAAVTAATARVLIDISSSSCSIRIFDESPLARTGRSGGADASGSTRALVRMPAAHGGGPCDSPPASGGLSGVPFVVDVAPSILRRAAWTPRGDFRTRTESRMVPSSDTPRPVASDGGGTTVWDVPLVAPRCVVKAMKRLPDIMRACQPYARSQRAVEKDALGPYLLGLTPLILSEIRASRAVVAAVASSEGGVSLATLSSSDPTTSATGRHDERDGADYLRAEAASLQAWGRLAFGPTW